MKEFVPLLLLGACTSIPKIDREPIRQVFRAHERDVRSCYETSLKVDPKLSGKVVMQIDYVDGRVTKSSIAEEASTLRDKQLLSCMLEKSKTWIFPPAPREKVVEIRYPYFFSAESRQ
jgi:hypothetical protein